MKRLLFILLLALVGFVGKADAQQVALKTNALYWATTTPNLGMEVGLGRRTTIDLMAGYNPFTLNKELNKKVKHISLMPEVRYWFCESFNGHFIGINGNYSQFNVSAIPVPNVFFDIMAPSHEVGDPKTTRNQGWAAGAGITYGYQWILGKRWNLEATLGLGYWYTVYDQFESRKCGLFQNTIERHMVGPTRCGLSFIYLFK